MYGPKKMQEGGIASMIAPAGVQNQMYGQPQRISSGVPGYDAGYSQAPGQTRPALPPEPYPIGRPTGVVGGPAYYTPPGFQAPPQPTEAFMPTDVRPDPIGQQFMRQYESPMGQQFIDQYEATQAPLRQAELEAREAERARQDQRFQELMDRIAELEGQLSAAQEVSPVDSVIPEIPGYDPNNPFNIDLSGLPDFSQIDFSGIPDFLKNLNIPGITDRPMEGTGREEEPMDRFDPRDTRFAIDSVTGEVIPEEDVILRPMPIEFPDGSQSFIPLPPPAPRTDPGAILDSERRLNEQFGSNLKNTIPPNFTLPGGIPIPRTPVPFSGELPPEIFTEGSPEAPEISPTVSDAPSATIMESPQSTTYPGLPKFDPTTIQEALSMDIPNIGKIVDPAMPKVLPSLPAPRAPRPVSPIVSQPPKISLPVRPISKPSLPAPRPIISRPVAPIRPMPISRAPISIPSLPISRTERPMPSMPNIPRINLSRLGIR